MESCLSGVVRLDQTRNVFHVNVRPLRESVGRCGCHHQERLAVEPERCWVGERASAPHLNLLLALPGSYRTHSSPQPISPEWARPAPETLLLGRSPVNGRACLAADCMRGLP